MMQTEQAIRLMTTDFAYDSIINGDTHAIGARRWKVAANGIIHYFSLDFLILERWL